MRKPIICLIAISFFFFQKTTGQNKSDFVKDNFIKIDTMIKMRDGMSLYTVIYVPKETNEKYPFLLERTPYSCGPYGDTSYATSIGPNPKIMK